MTGANNYTPDGVNPRTYQKKVTVHHDMNAVLFDPTDPNSIVVAAGQGVSAAVDVEADKDITLFISTTNAFTIVPQFTDDGAADPDWYQACDAAGAVLSFTNTAQKKAIPISVKAKQFRVLVTNGGASDEAPYIGVM